MSGPEPAGRKKGGGPTRVGGAEERKAGTRAKATLAAGSGDSDARRRDSDRESESRPAALGAPWPRRRSGVRGGYAGGEGGALARRASLGHPSLAGGTGALRAGLSRYSCHLCRRDRRALGEGEESGVREVWEVMGCGVCVCARARACVSVCSRKIFSGYIISILCKCLIIDSNVV